MERKHIRALILTEGGDKIGYGHITRCLSLYQALEEEGIKPYMLIRGDESVTDLLSNIDFEIYDWLNLYHYDILRHADIVIIDSYQAPPYIYEEISKTVKIPMYIDDIGRLDYPKGILLNGNIYANELYNKKRSDILYLLGPKYIPLRKEFWNISNKRKIKERISSLMITFGGSDLRNLTPFILKILVNNFPSYKKKVIIGKGFEGKNIKKIKNIMDENTEIIYNPNANTLINTMLSSDIAISAGGQTLYELARTGTPSIVISVAENQLRNARASHKAGFVKYIGWWEYLKYRDIFKAVKFLESYYVRKYMYNKGISCVDGLGSLRVAKLLKKLLI